jgi:hypothetical protein
MSYESWRISFQSSEQAARTAYAELDTLRAELVGAIKARNAAIMLYNSARQYRDDLLMQRREWCGALATLEGEREANALLTSQIAASEGCAEQYRAALKDIIDDLEIRSLWKASDQKGVVEIGHGAYMRGKAALAEQEGKTK